MRYMQSTIVYTLYIHGALQLVLRMPPDDGALGRPSAVPAGRGAASSWQKRIRSESRSEPSGAECGPHDEPQPAVVLVTGMMLCPSLLHPPVRACSTSSTAGLALLWTGHACGGVCSMHFC